jgi:hypothetical protein
MSIFLLGAQRLRSSSPELTADPFNSLSFSYSDDGRAAAVNMNSLLGIRSCYLTAAGTVNATVGCFKALLWGLFYPWRYRLIQVVGDAFRDSCYLLCRLSMPDLNRAGTEL